MRHLRIFFEIKKLDAFITPVAVVFYTPHYCGLCFIGCNGEKPHKLEVSSSFSSTVRFYMVESFGGRETVLSLRGKSHGALSVALFNGSTAILTPSCLRALFPYCYCTISYPCGCLADIKAYLPCQLSKLSSTEGGEKGRERKGR